MKSVTTGATIERLSKDETVLDWSYFDEGFFSVVQRYGGIKCESMGDISKDKDLTSVSITHKE